MSTQCICVALISTQKCYYKMQHHIEHLATKIETYYTV